MIGVSILFAVAAVANLLKFIERLRLAQLA